jgi:hypothetical protein
MLLRKVAAVVTVEEVMAAEVMVEVTGVEGIFMVVAMAGDISAVGISVVAGATSAVDRRCLARLRGRASAAIVLSPCGR